MPKRKDIKKGKQKTNRLFKHKYRIMFLLIPFLLGFGLWVATQTSPQTGPQTGPQIGQSDPKPSPRQAYLEILSEPHTGLRLARLDDFITHVPLNSDTARAKSRRDILGIYEQNAWADLTNVLYDLDKTREDKNRAVTDYKEKWGIWNRQIELPKLLWATGLSDRPRPNIEAASNSQADNDEYILANFNPNQTISRFAKGRHKTVLAGGPSFFMTASTSPNALSLRNGQNRPVRVKFAKSPRYPRSAFRNGISGQITLALDINERGHVVRTTVISADAPRYKDKFVRAAKRAAMASKFHPRTIAGQAVATSRYVRKYSFTAGG